MQGLAVSVEGILDGAIDSSVDAEGESGVLVTGSGQTDGAGGVLTAAINGEGGVAGQAGTQLVKSADCPDNSSLPDTGGSNLGLLVAGGALVLMGTGVVLVAERRRKLA